MMDDGGDAYLNEWTNNTICEWGGGASDFACCTPPLPVHTRIAHHPTHPTPQVRESECDVDFIRTLLPTISWKGLRAAATDLGLDAETIPEAHSPEIAKDEEFLQALHKTLFDIHVMEGKQ